ncbi:MAG: hypothetical protein A2700_02395 [Candidatus Blackburnbacteria bacterium RIFCSPHIGHO2_01_FULL_44_64]|uniref:Type IV pilus modification protein PilV n=1 Tax=Candidatus Blackburnbacteria bacterium RIFCSPHIGHO2_02_FULL_44_20 TaxID=1797516 RepID=A0A1G1V7L4_9BACT|nr:MAG: hypothetical protein A2700_02395 [Candidatus Blackburnbacteria bacterium RIFCSPHIGHO2_01_FULL_44_64]OGY11333.1 MAG: hypothetical protein A3D26_02400 [Candidatus Blackburnbacteria bacterium RIFCSPHIGHO2_02_FULL_44_20]OGY11440.1 MAG: hypothetical protein A3E16_02145 [Candidatus Blackburnbacteria bacterium RIFCSPHIGHO2_12_FULL_44_25]OGY14363.1 MAG: hypothetical protein A3A62_01715 [Candidatus Blackburnbacteria bacterium RIFCSPLOWO2_01_FULL_44_43]OGY17249.1 MAG: hypothetical protein A3H88_0
MRRLAVRRNAGQTFVELVIVLAVIGVIVTGVVGVVAISVRNARFSSDQARSSRYAQEAIEWVRQQRDSGWASFAARSGRTYCMQDLTWNLSNPCTSTQVIANSNFIREASLTGTDADTITVEVTVSWTDSGGEHSSKLSTILTSWTEK